MGQINTCTEWAGTVCCPACEWNGPLGLITGAVKDWQISASSTYPSNWDEGCETRYARVYQPNGVAWCAKTKSASEWLQVDLGVPAKVRPPFARRHWLLDRRDGGNSLTVTVTQGWLGSRVVSVLDSGAVGLSSNRSRDAAG